MARVEGVKPLENGVGIRQHVHTLLIL